MRFLSVLFGLIFSLYICTTSITAADPSESVTGELVEKCTLPVQPPIPNGKKATEAEMIAAQQSLKAYIADGDKFITCLDEIEKNWTAEELEEKKPLAIMVHNRIVDDMSESADLFNASLRAYKSKK